jgi:hypothetical protein
MSETGGGVTWRIAFSIISTAVWLIFVLYWIGFLWADFEIGQNVASLCISSVVFAGLNALVWSIWPRPKSSD